MWYIASIREIGFDKHIWIYNNSSILKTENVTVFNDMRSMVCGLYSLPLYMFELHNLDTGECIMENGKNLKERNDIIGFDIREEKSVITLYNYYEAAIHNSLEFDTSLRDFDFNLKDAYADVFKADGTYRFYEFLSDYSFSVNKVRVNKYTYSIVDLLFYNIGCVWKDDKIYFTLQDDKEPFKFVLLIYNIKDEMAIKINLAKLQLLEG